MGAFLFFFVEFSIEISNISFTPREFEIMITDINRILKPQY